jgi:hypothetical protein
MYRGQTSRYQSQPAILISAVFSSIHLTKFFMWHFQDNRFSPHFFHPKPIQRSDDDYFHPADTNTD